MHFPWSKPQIERSSNWPSKAKFCEQVDFAVQLFKLNPDLPEIRSLKNEYDELSTDRSFDPMHYLTQLNPDEYVYRAASGGIKISERSFGYVLNLWSLVRHHYEYVDDELTHIVADNTGTHLFHQKREIAKLEAGTINPHRLADPGNRYRIACSVIKEFTGVELNWRDHVGRTVSITVAKSDNGTWIVSTNQLTTTA